MISDPTGRFKERPFYEPGELDRECERLVTMFLKELHGKVDYPIATDDLTKLIERHVADLDSHADLGHYGSGVEGVTEFTPRKKPTVRIAAALAGEAYRENRLRTTLTHELGHVLFHTWLFDLRAGDSLFPIATKKGDDTQICKRDTIVDAPQTDWMEWQAGHVCGAILIPGGRARELAAEVAKRVPPPELAAVTPSTPFARALVDAVVERFQVSADCARVRAQRLNLISQS
jgi:hypothetical protein